MTQRGLALVTALVLSVAAAPLLAAGGAAGSWGRQATAATATAVTSTAAAAAAPSGFVRADQVGYLRHETKLAYLMTTTAAPGQHFIVRNASGRRVLDGVAGASLGSWNAAYPAVYPLDLSGLHVLGDYTVDVAGLTGASATIRVAKQAELGRPQLRDFAAFFQAQRDGADVVAGPLQRKPSHLRDAKATVYDWPTYEDPDSDVIVGNELNPVAGPVNVAGGWFDAGDFIKFAHTTAYADTLLLLTQRRSGAATPPSLKEEIRFGLRWLHKAWDPQHNAVYIQVGIGSGNQSGSFNGDHDVWRLPQRDDKLTGRANRYLRDRPVFATDARPGKLAPNLAGRMAATFALAAQVDARSHPARAARELRTAAEIFGRAKTHDVRPQDVVTALPHAFYPESSWRDDLELGAVELTRAGSLLGDRRSSGWLTTAAHWARAYIRQEAGSDTLNLYDVSAIGHAEILSAARHHHGDLVLTRRRLLGDLRDQLAIGQRHAASDPFRAGGNYDDFDVASHTFGLIATVKLLKLVTGTHRYDTFATSSATGCWAQTPGARRWSSASAASSRGALSTLWPTCRAVGTGHLPCCGVPSSTDPTRWTCSATGSASSSTTRPPARPTARMSTRSSPGAAASSSTTCGRG